MFIGYTVLIPYTISYFLITPSGAGDEGTTSREECYQARGPELLSRAMGSPQFLQTTRQQKQSCPIQSKIFYSFCPIFERVSWKN